MPKTSIIFFKMYFKEFHLSITDILFLTYGFCIDLRINQLYNLVNVREEYIIKFKDRINRVVVGILEDKIEKLVN